MAMEGPSFNLLAFSKDPGGGIPVRGNSPVSREPTEIPPFFKSLQW